MDIEEYERMYELEDSYWWFQGRMYIIEAILRRFMKNEPRRGRVLDIGCGTGLMLEHMLRWNPVGLDFSPLSLHYCRQRGARRLMRADVVHLPFQDESMDLVLALDLIEHVKEDGQLVREVHRILRPGGWFMATVPAHQWLWSDHDISLHHQRRYSYTGFRKLLKGAGLRPVKYTFAITFTYFPIIAFRKLQWAWQHSTGVRGPARPRTHLIPLPWFLNAPLIQLLRVEGWLLRYVDLPVGISLMALCRKTER